MGLEAAKRARLREKGDDGANGGEDRRSPYVWSGSGRATQVLPGPLGVYTIYSTRVEAVGSTDVEQLAETRRAVQEAEYHEAAEDRTAVARTREDQEAEARCLSVRVASAQQQGRGAAGEEATDRRQEEGQERAAGEMRRSSGLIPSPSVNKTAEIEGEFAEPKAERKPRPARDPALAEMIEPEAVADVVLRLINGDLMAEDVVAIGPVGAKPDKIYNQTMREEYTTKMYNVAAAKL